MGTWNSDCIAISSISDTVRVNINGQIVYEAGIVLKILESFYL